MFVELYACYNDVTMLEEKKIAELLEKLDRYELDTLERVILANDGTVQSLLSVVMRVPISVEIISEMELFGNIYRWVKLVAKYSDVQEQTVCLAMSVIPIEENAEDFIAGLKEQKLGIGQLLSSLGFVTKRELLGFYSDNMVFARTYRITGNKIKEDVKCDLLITEIFPKAIYEKVGEKRGEERKC